MPWAELNGCRWNYLDVGSGPVILFVHGFPLDHTMWRQQWDAFSESYRCVVPDLCGFGESQSVEGALSMSRLADDLAALLDYLRINEPAVFCGLSMGGYVGWQMWQRHRHRLRLLVQCDTRAVADSPEVAKGRELMAQTIHQLGAASVADSMTPKLFSPRTKELQPELLRQLHDVISTTDPNSIAAAQRGMAGREDFSAALANMDLPTLFVCGVDDQISPPEEMRRMSEVVVNARFVEVPAAGHMAPLENPAVFNAALREFLTAHAT